MPLNKLENFIKNTDGRTLYVNPADLNATDSISNQGTSLTEPFRTIQRALLESARFSYVRGDDNDLIERTTIVLYPGEHTIDNRPGYGIRLNEFNDAVAVSPSNQEVVPSSVFNLTSDTNFDIESSNNILWHFNSIYGGCIVPRGTSIVGMDLRKTKIRPKYVPNPTDPTAGDSAIFRITGTCYFWQFTIFDGDENGFVFTDPRDFSTNNQSRPTFSHHKLTAFEYADGVNVAAAKNFTLTDLQMYYSKLTNAYNEASGRPIDEKYPEDPGGFAPQRPEFEIVGAFATDPVRIASLISGDGFTPDAVVTVETVVPHGLSAATPIKIRGVAVGDYNISTKVASILSPNRFTYVLSFVRPELPPRPSVSSATVTVETDTVTGASPYIFNCSMRSVWGINGMHADGAKATGFRSMVVAQFTAISLQKDDRAFAKYDEQGRRYNAINLSQTVRGAELSAQSSSTNSATVYHLDPQAVYRPEWDTTHIKMSNDAVIQIVSVFAIGFNQHFSAINGADASITNSNSNFGQFALLSDGFKNDAFDKDDKGFISQIITPNNAFNPETDTISDIGYVNIDFDLTRSTGLPGQLYLLGYSNKEDRPPFINQGYRIGANYEEVLYQPTANSGIQTSSIRMVDNLISESNRVAGGTFIGRKVYPVLAGPGSGGAVSSTLQLPTHGLINGESIRVVSANGDLPENIEAATLYYANVIDAQNIRISTSESNALNDIFLDIYGGTDLRIESRVNDKEAGEKGHPIQYDEIAKNWFIYTGQPSGIYNYINSNSGSTDGFDFVTVFKRNADNRNLDDKLYRLRYVVPKESRNAKPPTPGYVIQDSSTTGPRDNDDFIINNIGIEDYDYNRNPRYIAECDYVASEREVAIRSEVPHQLRAGDKVNIINVVSTFNEDATYNRGYNGEFLVTRIIDARNFRYSITDVNGFTRNLVNEVFDPSTTQTRNILLPRFQKKNNQGNVYVYRVEQISEFIEGIRDGIYHLFCINGSNEVKETFTDRKYNQPIEDLYPQLDTDNIVSNPPASVTFANRAPLGKVNIDELQNSVTRETLDKFINTFNENIIETVLEDTDTTQITFAREHNFGGVYGYSTLNGGSGYPDGTFYNVKLLDQNPGQDGWKGATAKVTVVSGTVIGVTITDPGAGHIAGNTLNLDPAGFPDNAGGAGASITPPAEYIEDGVGVVLQVTGGGLTNPDRYVIINEVIDRRTITITNESASGVVEGMYALPTDIASTVSTYSFDNDGDIPNVSTFTGSDPRGFGLQRGNSFIVFDGDGLEIGKYYVTSVPTPNSVTAVTVENLTSKSPAFIGKCGFEDNDASTGSVGENIGIRGSAPFDNGQFWIGPNSTNTNTDITIVGNSTSSATGLGIKDRLYLGRYVQVGSEIMRVASTAVSGTDQNIVKFIRGALGTKVINHPAYSKVRAINPLAVELRRPSILRASGHTFEYLGYGPGNYSTSLPQLQVRQLPDEEVFLVQAQELACGQVVYTGMSDNGDFYIGNTKYSATSGTQTTFDVPIPTVAGQSASSNNVVFDEVIVNRRLFVAGGETNEVLSQFDGPVKFTKSVNIENSLVVTQNTTLNTLTVTSQTNASNSDNGGAFTVRGGAAFAKDVYVGGKLDLDGDFNVGGNLTVEGNVDVEGDYTSRGSIDIDGSLSAAGGDFSGDVAITGGLTVGTGINLSSGDINIGSSSGRVITNIVEPFDSSQPMNLWTTQTSGNITVGSSGDRQVFFRTTKDNTGRKVDQTEAGVQIDGGLVVKKTVVAERYYGKGLGAGPGSIVMWGGSTATIPESYRLCNGAYLRVSDFPDAATAINFQFGSRGSGSNREFRLPDLRDRFVVGAAGRYSVAETGGSDSVKLTTSDIANHIHGTRAVNLAHNHRSGSTFGTDNDDATHSISGTTNASSRGGGEHRHGSPNGLISGETTNADDNGKHSHAFDVNTEPHSHRQRGYRNQDNANRGDRRNIVDDDYDGTITDEEGNNARTGTAEANVSVSVNLASGTSGEGRHRHKIEATVPTTRSAHRHDFEVNNIKATHNHGVNFTIASNLVDHNHQVNENQFSSDVTAHENRPPYFALCYIIQVE